ncbi:TetR/AcrR family transcriptional regulator [Pseudonocardia sp. HH130629-09]|uniref:TetR/AcrR family transcriptional regulator n=1 Tax=Pseudonocardia sp. HH130629-09 TaxID=1641402 RepID=UPI0006CB1199|nr:TetR/AcrR family transcriptional regulator [Pseudonocardia sp. HH130629-09]ALE85398.1 TetR family transcriptional regulator [Pseudonocardia sp. HH130629-09]
MARTRRGDAGAKVLDTASRLFYRDGINAVGVDTIAAEAGVTKTALYTNFGSKDRLVVAYLRERDRRWQEEVDRITAGHASPRERVLAVVDAYESWQSRDGFRGCAFLNAASELPRLDHPAREVVRHHKAALRSYLQAQVDRLAPDGAAAALAGTLMILLEGAVATAVVEQGTGPFRAAREVVAGMLPAA